MPTEAVKMVSQIHIEQLFIYPKIFVKHLPYAKDIAINNGRPGPIFSQSLCSSRGDTPNKGY